MDIDKKELEHKHNLIGSEQLIYPTTVIITGALPVRNGKVRPEAVPATEKSEAIA